MLARLGILLSATLVAGLCVSATIEKRAAAESAARAGASNCEPTWYSSRDIGNGVALEVWVGCTETVVDPTTNADARAVHMHVNFLHGVGVMQQIDSLKLFALTDRTPQQFHMAGIDRNIVAPHEPPYAPLNYTLTVTPKAGVTWGTMRGVQDLDIVATQI